VFSTWSTLRCYELDNSTVLLVGRQSLASKGMSREAEEAVVVEAITDNDY
jgi:hypothetical protein